MEHFDTNKLIEQVTELSLHYIPKLTLAIATLIIGLFIIRRLINVVDKLLDFRKVDDTLQKFLHSLFDILLKALLLISVASMIGIETTSFIAILGAAGLAIGMALQGSLSNFAGGVLILLFRPYKVGDLIDAQGHLGVVKEIQIFNTIIVTPENKRVILPNGIVSNGVITNLSAESILRVDMTFGIGYSDDIEHAKKVIKQVLETNDKILAEPHFDILVAEHGESSVNFAVRPWAKVDDYWDVYFGTTEQLKIAFDKAGISIPFPQRDVHLIKE